MVIKNRNYYFFLLAALAFLLPMFFEFQRVVDRLLLLLGITAMLVIFARGMNKERKQKAITIERKDNQTEYTMSLLKANIYVIYMLIPMFILFGLPFFYLWGDELVNKIRGFENLSLAFLLFILFFLGAFAVGVVLHELIHGLVFALFAKKGFHSIRFGIHKEYFTPYCHCKEALTIPQYITGALMPALLLGIVPLLLAFYTGSAFVWLFGMMFFAGAGGDFISVWMLSKLEKGTKVYDHPGKLGFIVKE